MAAEKLSMPWVVVAPSGVHWLGHADSEASAWSIALGWPDAQEVAEHKAQGWYASEATVSWKRPHGVTPTDGAPLPRIELELPDHDTRTAKVRWVQPTADGFHVCISVSDGVAIPQAPRAVTRAIEVLEEALTYIGSPSWSPSMLNEAGEALAGLRALACGVAVVPVAQPVDGPSSADWVAVGTATRCGGYTLASFPLDKVPHGTMLYVKGNAGVMVGEDDLPPSCECDNTHQANDTVCRWCWTRGRRHWNDPEINAGVPVVHPPGEWEEAQRIRDLPAVDEAIRNMLEDQTGDNSTCMVREVLRAAGVPPSGDQTKT